MGLLDINGLSIPHTLSVYTQKHPTSGSVLKCVWYGQSIYVQQSHSSTPTEMFLGVCPYHTHCLHSTPTEIDSVCVHTTHTVCNIPKNISVGVLEWDCWT